MKVILSKQRSRFLIVPLLSFLFLLFEYFTTGIRNDHLVLVALASSMYYASASSRRMITGLAIIIFYWILYDSMKAWPNWAYHTVDIEPLYNLEKKIFGIHQAGYILTPNEYFIIHQSSAADIICSLFYLCWIPLPLIFAFYLYFKNKNLFLRFCFAFLVVNCIGFIIYYIHPAAPPWYYAMHKNVFIPETKSYAAGLLRFDKYFGIDLFGGLYSKGSNVFAAMPSLHSSYPLIGLVYAVKIKSHLFKIIFATVMTGIWFAAIYLSHHYILDVIAGIACGITGILFFEKILMNKTGFKKLFSKYEENIKGI